MEKIFRLAPNAPIRAALKGRGVVQLDSISNELALELAKEGCPYIVLTNDGVKLAKPAEKTIEIKKTPPIKNTRKGAGKK